MNHKSNILKVAKTALLMLFGWFWIASSLFTHLHIIDGKLTAHSHPFTSASHSHTAAEFFGIQQFTTFDDNSTNQYSAHEFFAYFLNPKFPDVQQHIDSFVGHYSSLRGPPALSFS